MNFTSEPYNSLDTLINTVKDYRANIETMSPSENRKVASMYSAVYNNFHLLLSQDFKTVPDYLSYKEFAKRVNANFMDVQESITNGEQRYTENGFLLVRLSLSFMLLGIES